jgi:peptide chain release factor 1
VCPSTEAQGRIHTSACTVAVLAEAEDTGDITIDPSELRIDVYRASGAGGQHVNKTDVGGAHHPPAHRHRRRVPGRPLAASQQGQGDEGAARAPEGPAGAGRPARAAAHRRSLIGSGDRSERIRTYNFPQGRITDHRINLTLYKIQAMMDGDLDELLDGLSAAQAAAQIEAMAEQDRGFQAPVRP